jgi:hypothetical protein
MKTKKEQSARTRTSDKRNKIGITTEKESTKKRQTDATENALLGCSPLLLSTVFACSTMWLPVPLACVTIHQIRGEASERGEHVAWKLVQRAQLAEPGSWRRRTSQPQRAEGLMIITGGLDQIPRSW